MNKSIQVQLRLDSLCLKRLTSSDFAQKQNLKTRIIRWMKGGAK